MMRWLFLGILILAAEFATADELRIATHEWPPFISEKIKGKGPQVELIRAAFEAKGYGPIHFDIMPYARSLKETAQLHYDAMMPVYMTRERAADFLFSDSYQVVETLFMIRAGESFAWKKLQDFAALNVGTIQSYSYGQEFDEAPYLKKVVVGSNSQLLRMLGNQRIDVFLIEEPVARYLLGRELPFLIPKLVALNPPYKRNDCHLVVSRKHPRAQTLIDDFNAGLQIIRRDGTLARILARLRSTLLDPEDPSRQDPIP